MIARQVSGDGELIHWAELCSLGFSHKPGTSASRFYNRFAQDSYARLDWVRVTVTPEGLFVGSVRMLERSHEVHDGVVRSCGIGEGKIMGPRSGSLNRLEFDICSL